MAKKSTQKYTPEATPETTPKPTQKEQTAEKSSKKGKKKQTEDDRATGWACVIYPAENSLDFEKVIGDLLLEGFLSPLHTDKDEEKELEKKPHRHFMAKFPSKKSRKQAEEVFKKFGGVGAEHISNWRAYSRYLCHLDQPDKKRYDPADVKTFGSLDYLETIESTSDRYRVIAEIMDFCDQNWPLIHNSFAQLLRYCREEGKEDWFRHLCDDSARIVGDYLKSAEWEDTREARQKDRENDLAWKQECRDRERKRWMDSHEEKGEDAEA